MNRLEKMMHNERYMRNGAIQLNLLKYDIVWVVSRWGFIGKEGAAEYFKFVASLFEDDKDVKAKRKKKTATKKEETKVELDVESVSD